jgi:glycosyltransferase involved in cell wall biosynthesis
MSEAAADPVLSVVIPSYNYGRYLDACLDSIFGQVDPPSFEVIVVDDASTDDSMEVHERRADARLRVVRHERNQGHAGAINTGLPLARGRIISRIDPDDRYRPHFMRTVCAAFDRHPEAILVYGQAALIDAAGEPSGAQSGRPHEGDFVGPELLALLERNFICAPTMAARREGWNDALPVPGHLAFHDWYFSVLMARRGACCFVDDVLAEYRVHGANLHSSIARSGEEERSVLWLLDRVFAEPEADAQAEASKQAAKRRIYAAHYLDFAEKYFWFEKDADARRCYLAAARRRPGVLLRPGVTRRALGTFLGRRLYERLKRVGASLSKS